MSRYGVGAQVMALVLLVMVAALTLTALAIAKIPPPEPPQIRVADMLRVVQDLRLAPQYGLRATYAESPSPGVSIAAIEQVLAPRLGVPASSISAVWPVNAERPAPSLEILSVDAGPMARRCGDDAAACSATETASAAFGRVLLQTDLRLPAFTLSVRQDDHRWLILEPDADDHVWRLRLLVAFAACALVMVPVALLATRWVVRPIRTLGDIASRVAQEQLPPALPDGGPREVRAAAAAMLEMASHLREQTRERLQMLAAVAHDLRTPLTSLRLRADLAPESSRQRMIDDIDRMERMIRDVLEYAGGEYLPPTAANEDLMALMQDCVATMREQGHALEFTPGSPLYVSVDAQQLRRAILNLLHNAVRYAHGVEAAIGRSGDVAWLEIRDHGPGIDPSQIARLLKPFQRLDSSRNIETGGVGLGLSVAETITRRNGGHLRLFNREQGGFCARIELPVAH